MIAVNAKCALRDDGFQKYLAASFLHVGTLATQEIKVACFDFSAVRQNTISVSSGMQVLNFQNASIDDGQIVGIAPN